MAGAEQTPLRRLLPECGGETTVAEAIGGLDLVSRALPERPYVVTNFVVTLDGHATLHGRSGPIGSAVDTAMLVALRTRVDALMIGAGTMRAERYGRALSDPAKRERREREGLAPDPLMVLISSRLDLPWDAPLFTEGAGQVLVFTNSDQAPPQTETALEVIRQPGDRVDMTAALAHVREEREVRALLCEGGPRLHGDLIAAELVDELFITQAPKLGGGVGPGLASALDEGERPVEVDWLLAEAASGELFGRYRLPAG
jgi:riboflavin-specific deaminase-like protein